jgi:protocatechuate 3,4-dioxygenase beta subunit/beta-lactamase regulating signal transducer with metallopeptidase domain
MTRLDSFALWLADYYVLSTLLLVLALIGIAALAQPVRRLAIVKSSLMALVVLAALCALPGWSVVHVMTEERQALPPVVTNEPRTTAPASTFERSLIVDRPALRHDLPALPSTAIDAPAANEDSTKVSWQSMLVWVQIGGGLAVCVWLALGWLAAQRLRRCAVPAPSQFVIWLQAIADAKDNRRRRVALLTCDRIDVAAALGIWRPIILLPADWVGEQAKAAKEATPTGVSAEHVRGVLAHELAHVENHDLIWLAVSRGLMIFLWSQPLYWLARRRMRLDQEALADAAAAELSSRQQYAEQLVHWARNMGGQRTVRLASAVGLWEGPSQLRQRVGLLLNERLIVLRNCSRKWRLATLAASAILATGLSLLTLQPGHSAQSPPLAEQPASEHTGTLIARFVYDGEPPAPKELSPPPMHGRAYRPIGKELFAKNKIVDESLIVGPERGVANVFVWVRSKDIPVPPAENLPPVAISFKNGRYEPHAIAFRAPREVLCSVEEPFGCNFKYQGINSQYNLLVQAGEQKSFVAKPEPIPVHLQGNLEPWLSAWMLPLGHPYFAVSGDDGVVKIKNLPPGKWEFQVWHERKGYLRRDDWPRGRFTLDIKPGDNILRPFKLAPDVFGQTASDANRSTQKDPVRAPGATKRWSNFVGNDTDDQLKIAERDAGNQGSDATMPTPNTVGGQAVDEKGQPVAGAGVFLFRINQRFNQRDAARKQVGQTKTDAEGRFRFDNVIDIEKEFPNKKFPPSFISGDELLQVFVRAPGKATASWLATPAVVAQRGDWQRMTMAAAATLSGRVTGPDGKPVAGALVSGGWFSGWEGATSSRTDADGNYKIDDGTAFDVNEYKKQVAEQERRQKEQAQAGGKIFNLFISRPILTVEHPDFATRQTTFDQAPGKKDVQLEKAAILEGRVIFADTGKPAAGALIEAASAIDLNAARQQISDIPVFNRATARTNADGTYRITSLPAGKYNIWADTPNWVNDGAQAVAATAGKTIKVPDLKFTKGGLISARLIDAKSRQPIKLTAGMQAMITASENPPTMPGRPIYNSFSPPNSEGRFEVRATPGKKSVAAGAVGTDGQMKWFGPTPTEMTLADGQTAEIDLPVEDAEQAMKEDHGGESLGSAPDASESKQGRLGTRDTIKTLTAELEENPEHDAALMNRAIAFSHIGDDRKSLADYERLLKLDIPYPRNLVVYNNVAFLLATSPDDKLRDGKRAVELAEKAKQFNETPSADLLDTLAAAYAESGDFDRAIKTEREAIQQAKQEKRSDSFAESLKLYEAHKPRRDNRADAANASEEKNEGAATEPPSVQPTELAGTVVDADGKPLAGVTVDVWTWYPGNETKSDETGHFRLKGFEPREQVEVEFRKENYCPRLFVSVPAGTADWDVRMDNDTYFEGRMSDSDGKAVVGAVIRAEHGPFRNPGVVIDEVATETTTDNDGHYRLYVMPDTYDIKIRVPGRGVARYQHQSIGAGGKRQLDLQLDRGITLRANVIDSLTGDPVQGITLWKWNAKGIEGTSNADGLLEIPSMFPGKFEFSVTAAGQDRHRSSVAGNYARWWSEKAVQTHQRSAEIDGHGFQRNFDDLEFDISADAEPVTIFVEPCVTIAGRVVDPDGKPVAGATVAPAKTGSGNSLTGDTRFSYETRKDGTFEMKLPASGLSQYNLIAHDGKYEQWRKWANGAGAPFTTKPGDHINNVELRLTRPATVRGIVKTTDGKPAVGIDVRATDVNNRDNRYYHPTTKTDKQGRFELKFVSPGKHFIQSAPFWLQSDQAPGRTSALVELKDGETKEDVSIETPQDSQTGGRPSGIPAILVQQTTAAGADSKRTPTILSYGDGKPDGKKSYGGSGHLIRFEMPEGVTKVKGIRIHGSRYGLPQAPDENFEVTFLSDDRSETLDSKEAPYHLFKRGKEQWVRVMFDKEVELPKKFWIALNFNAQQTKGVYVSYDTSTKGEYSRVGLVGDKEEPKETDFKGDWMVQVMLVRPEK